MQCTLQIEYCQKLRWDSLWEIYTPEEGKLSTQLFEVLSYFVKSLVFWNLPAEHTFYSLKNEEK